MSDAVLIKTGGIYDFQLDANGDIDTADMFDTAILMSIYCERRASASEVPISSQRRGWIGNESFDDFENGSKFWLYQQARATRTILNGIVTAVQNGLQWFVDDGIATSVAVTAELNGLTVVIERPNSNVDRRYYEIWNNTGA